MKAIPLGRAGATFNRAALPGLRQSAFGRASSADREQVSQRVTATTALPHIVVGQQCCMSDKNHSISIFYLRQFIIRIN